MPLLHWLNDDEARKTSARIPVAAEKQNIAERWAEASNRQPLFLMAVQQDPQGRGLYKQIHDTIEGRAG
jgi:hypothetical protein